jgi:LmbE family N-acetylglucosaminyl deacetylase
VTDDQQGGLAAVFAHPDDESFGCAGAMALARDAGRPVRLLVVTRGGQARLMERRTRTLS